MEASISFRPFARAMVFWILGGATLYGCGGSGSGDGLSGGRLRLDSITAQSGPGLPWDEVFVNERLNLRFSVPVDPLSVTRDTIQIRAASTAFTTGPSGCFVVRGTVVSFVPDLPTQADLSDAGFAQGERYRIFLPGHPRNHTVRSLGGDRLSSDFSVSFRTRVAEPFLLDPVSGPPRVTAIALDLDGDGSFEADGSPSTPDPEEFLNLEDPLLMENTPVGLARAPLSVGVLLNEPLLPTSVFHDPEEDGVFNRIQMIDRSLNSALSIDVSLDQRFFPEEDRYLARLILSPRTTLPAGTEIEVRLLGGLTDSANPPFSLPAFSVVFETEAGPAHFEDALVETFETRDRAEPSNSAGWNVNESGVLIAGTGIGGTGSDGSLRVASGQQVVLNTRRNEGFFNFTEVVIEENGVLVGEGPFPLRLFCLGDVTIDGAFRVDGGDGEAGSRRGGALVVKGGQGGPGAGDGGNANDPPSVSLSEVRCQLGESGGSPATTGGGEGGKTSTNFSGGGAGGGFGEPGMGVLGGNNARGGDSYGDAEISELVSGSGGGGGGDGSPGNRMSPLDESTGGAGGGGGGAVLINVGGRFSLTGSLTSNGGNGGAGGLDRGNQAPGGGGGGGGSGGAIKVQALSADPIVGSRVQVLALGGIRGMHGGGGSRSGGDGGAGRIRFEVFDQNRNGILDPSELLIDSATADLEPLPSEGLLEESGLGVSVAQSKFLDTGTRNPRFAFDSSDPSTGRVDGEAGGEDLRFAEGIPENASVFVFFEGAHPDPLDPRRPDPTSFTGFRPEISELDGFQFIRFRIEFEIGPDLETAPRPTIQRIRIRFEFEI